MRQIRAGYDKRPEQFPQSIILCGVRDIKDYRIHTGNNEIITGGSAFNIKAESLRLGNFSQEEVSELLEQHTTETGQKFQNGCFELIYNLTDGQPWLVNALAFEITFKMKENRDRSREITIEMILQAKENLILSRQTHLDQLADKLDEDRVRSVILPMILGETRIPKKDDEQYCIDLGLIKESDGGLVISNEIYKEIIPRELTESKQREFQAIFRPVWINENGTLNTDKLFTMFQDFWRENSDIWASHINGYQEAAPHLVFQAFLQRVANGNGRIEREYALARGRTDLMLKWKSENSEQKIVIELKILTNKKSYKTVKMKALEQTANYSDTFNATENHILIFDRDEKMNWREKVFIDFGEFNGVKCKIWGM